MTQKKVIPLLIDVSGESINPKLSRFFEVNSLEDQMKSINLWAWRSCLGDGELAAKPVTVKTGGVVSKDEWQNIISSLLESGATGMVGGGMDLLERVGLDQHFMLAVKKQGLEVWTSESVFPVPDDELLRAV